MRKGGDKRLIGGNRDRGQSIGHIGSVEDRSIDIYYFFVMEGQHWCYTDIGTSCV